MTLKDKVKKVNPEYTGEHLKGGVGGCPVDYPYLNNNSAFADSKCTVMCESCWNQPFIENPDVGTADE